MRAHKGAPPQRSQKSSGPKPGAEPEVLTLGCRLNAHESDIIRQHAKSQGLTNTVIVNSCAVTAEAVRRTRQSIRRARRHKPDARIIVTGCAAQIDSDHFTRMPEVDHILGNREKLDPRSYSPLVLDQARTRISNIMQVGPVSSASSALPAAQPAPQRTRAFVQVQTGCDHRCTFCIIPYGRGNSRSVPSSDLVGQIRRLVERGYKEVVLTGVDLTSYGADLGPGLTLGRLVADILAQVPDLPRLRLSSIDSIEVDEDLFDLISSEERVMPHLHLSLQSGDPMILKRMKRRHRPDEAVAFCARLKNRRPDIAFGADFIAGFPTETDAMFANTIRHVSDCGLTFLHVFPYSAREGTPAARMPQTPATKIKERAAELRALGERVWNEFASARIGSLAHVLVEQNQQGLSEDFAPVKIDPTGQAKTAAPGDLLCLRIDRVENNKLVGVPVS